MSVHQGLSNYQPYHALLILLLLLAIPLAVVWDQGYGDFVYIVESDEVAATIEHQNWIIDMVWRTLERPYALAMVFFFVVFFFYAVFQGIGLLLDKRWARCLLMEDSSSGIIPRLAQLLSPVTGRPKKLYQVHFPSNIINIILERHLVIGQTMVMAPLQFGLWLFPLLGFIGTVIGISGAIKHLPEATMGEGAIGPVLDNLYTAFDTTFLGLVSAVGLMCCLQLLNSSWHAYELKLEEITELNTIVTDSNNVSSKTDLNEEAEGDLLRSDD